MAPTAEEWLDRPGAGPRSAILVHDRCADGYTSAGLLKRRLPKARIVYVQPAHVADELEKLAGQRDMGHVVLADLGPQAADRDRLLDALRRLRGHAEVAWLDHHAPQWPLELERAVQDLGVETIVDRTGKECGASLAAQWTREADPGLRRVTDLIRRRDAWTDPHDADARAWTLVARGHGREFVARLDRADLAGLEAEGKRLLHDEEYRIEGALARVQRHSAGVAWLWGDEDISDAADRLFQRDAQVAFLLRFAPDGRVSVRSRPGHPKAAELAQRMGGGGHAHAAGFDLGLGWFARLGYRRRREKHPAVRRAFDEAQRWPLSRAASKPARSKAPSGKRQAARRPPAAKAAARRKRR